MTSIKEESLAERLLHHGVYRPRLQEKQVYLTDRETHSENFDDLP